MTKRVSFQGALGAYSDMACRTALPDYEPLPCITFDEAFMAVHDGSAELAMIPVENTVAGRVAAVHYLMRDSGLYAIGEFYQPVVHHLLTLPGAQLANIKKAYSHIHALPQCKLWLKENNIESVVRPDTAGSAEEVSSSGDMSIAAIASELAGEIYGLQSLAADIADTPGNTTRCLILSATPKFCNTSEGPCITTLIYRVRNTPAALYRTIGGFAKNAINLTRIESYVADGSFEIAQFWIDVEGHPEEESMKSALDELVEYVEEYRILGVYPASPARRASSKR